MSDYHGPKNLQEWTTWAKNRKKRNQHVVVGITGTPGKGKSSFGLLLSRKLDDGFAPQNQTVFGENNAARLGKIIGRGRVIHCDEGGDGGNKRRFMSGANVDVADHLDKCRKLNQFYLFTRPFWADFDTAIQSHIMWAFEINGLGRGVAREVQQYGVKKKYVRLVDRFHFTFGDCRVLFPELWQEYESVVYGHLQGLDRGDVQFRQEVQRQKQVVLRVVAESPHLFPSHTPPDPGDP